jgi:hypothetical protein
MCILASQRQRWTLLTIAASEWRSQYLMGEALVGWAAVVDQQHLKAALVEVRKPSP